MNSDTATALTHVTDEADLDNASTPNVGAIAPPHDAVGNLSVITHLYASSSDPVRRNVREHIKRERDMLAKVNQLPDEKQAELERWINAALAATKSEQLIEALHSVSEESFERIWNNPADAAYDDDV